MHFDPKFVFESLKNSVLLSLIQIRYYIEFFKITKFQTKIQKFQNSKLQNSIWRSKIPKNFINLWISRELKNRRFWGWGA